VILIKQKRRKSMYVIQVPGRGVSTSVDSSAVNWGWGMLKDRGEARLNGGVKKIKQKLLYM
jgi:hypothetical protein